MRQIGTDIRKILTITAEPETLSKDTNTTVGANDENKDNNNMRWLIIAIGAVVLIGGGITAVVLIKKKKANIAE